MLVAATSTAWAPRAWCCSPPSLMALSLLLWPLGVTLVLAGAGAHALGPGLLLVQFGAAGAAGGIAPALAPGSVALNCSGMYVGQAMGAAAGGWLIAHDAIAWMNWVGLATAARRPWRSAWQWTGHSAAPPRSALDDRSRRDLGLGVGSNNSKSITCGSVEGAGGGLGGLDRRRHGLVGRLVEFGEVQVEIGLRRCAGDGHPQEGDRRLGALSGTITGVVVQAIVDRAVDRGRHHQVVIHRPAAGCRRSSGAVAVGQIVVARCRRTNAV